MQYEVEQKFPIADRKAIRERLQEQGAIFELPIDQADTYFGHPARDFAQTDEALRLRQVGDENYVTYKGPKLDAQSKTRREIELPIAPGKVAGEQFAEILLALGFWRVLTVRKGREPGRLDWQGYVVHVALDHIDRLGHFLELEISADDSTLPEAKAALSNLAGRLELPSSERRSYLELLLEST